MDEDNPRLRRYTIEKWNGYIVLYRMRQEHALVTPLTVTAVREEVKGFKVFSFKELLPYKAGQYLTFALQRTGGEIRRSYSITSSPALQEPLSIGVKRIENGIFSRMLIDTVEPGDQLYSVGTGGFFTLPDAALQYQQIFFFAAGSGITPIYSLIKESLYRHPHLQIVLIYSNASVDKTVFYHELNELQHRFEKRFRIRYLFSNNPVLYEARLHKQLLEELVSSLAVAAPGERLYYVCGPEAYIRMCTFTLIENHVPQENIRRENFAVVPVRISKEAIPDRTTRRVTVFSPDGEIFFDVVYPDTILQAAKKQGIALPYSCETGRCGSCAATCISGTVWHSYNEVLTEKELDQGIILTCVGHPVNGDVKLLL